MKKLLLIICFLTSISVGKAQTKEDLLLSAQKAYWSVDYRKSIFFVLIIGFNNA